MGKYHNWLWLMVGLLLLAASLFGVPAQAAERVVLFDQGHGQRFMIEGDEPLGLAALADEFRAQGLTPRTLKGGMSAESLQGAAALVLSGPFQPLGGDEMAAISDFLARGGRLCVMLHIAEPVRPFLQKLGVAATRAPIREQVNLVGDNPLEFRVGTFAEHPVTAGLTTFTVNGCWGLLNTSEQSRVLAWSSPRSWSDMDGDGTMGPNEPPMPLGVLLGGEVGQGGFVVVGDDAVFQNQFLQGGNLKLAQNLAGWLKGGTGK